MDSNRKSTSTSSSQIGDENIPLRQQSGNKDLFQLVQMQQNTISRLTQEVNSKYVVIKGL